MGCTSSKPALNPSYLAFTPYNGHYPDEESSFTRHTYRSKLPSEWTTSKRRRGRRRGYTGHGADTTASGVTIGSSFWGGGGDCGDGGGGGGGE